MVRLAELIREMRFCQVEFLDRHEKKTQNNVSALTSWQYKVYDGLLKYKGYLFEEKWDNNFSSLKFCSSHTCKCV